MRGPFENSREIRQSTNEIGERLTENRVCGIHRHLTLRRVADQPLGLRERDVTRRGAIALVVGDDLHLAMTEDPDAGVRGAQVDADRWRRHCGLEIFGSDDIAPIIEPRFCRLFHNAALSIVLSVSSIR